MSNRRSQFDMTHAFTTYSRFCDLYAATVTDNALITYFLVFSAIAFPVFAWTEDALAEQTVTLWFL